MSTGHQLYQQLYEHLKRVMEWQHKEHLYTMAGLMTAIFNSRDVRLSRIAENMPLEGKEESVVQRIRRWLKNDAIEVVSVYEPFLKQILKRVVGSEAVVRLQMDRVCIGNRFNVLMVTLAYQGRALPLTWLMIAHMGNSNAHQRRKVLTYVAQFIESGVSVRVLADREFGDAATMRLIEHDLGWDYVLRVKGNQQVYLPGSGFPIQWHTVSDLVPDDSTKVATFSQVKYTQSELYLTNLVCTQPPPESGDKSSDPWIVATNLPPQPSIIAEYALRFGCEPLFSDLKSRGFNWEMTQLRHADRLSRLLLVLACLTTWMVFLGQALVESGKAALYWQPSHLKRYSLFQIGRRWLRKQLTLHSSLSLAFDLSIWHSAPT